MPLLGLVINPVSASQIVPDDLMRPIVELLAAPLGFTAVLLGAGFLLCVGAVTTLRWFSARITRLTRRRSRLAAKVLAWQNAPRIVHSASDYIHGGRADPFPLRRQHRPRDW